MSANPRVSYSASALLLKCVPLLAALPDEHIAMLTRVATQQSFARNATIIESGELSNSLYILLNGRAQVVVKEPRGDVIVFTLGPREFFGEMSLLDMRPRSASVIACEPCDLLVLSGDQFVRCLEKNPAMAEAVMRELVARLRAADNSIRSLALMDVYGRVARVLMEMAEDIDGQKVVTQRISKTEISKKIGASREMVSRVMKDLAARRRIEIREKSVVLLEGLGNWD